VSDADLEARNNERLGEMAAKGAAVNPGSLNDLRILSYLEVLLGDRVEMAESHFHRRLADDLDKAEEMAEQLASERRRQFIAGNGHG
jgi:hypothetical protein